MQNSAQPTLFATYEPISTGGGFVAYRRELDDLFILLTAAEDEGRLPTASDRVVVGIYALDSGEPLNAEDDTSDGLAGDQVDAYIEGFMAARATQDKPRFASPRP